MGNSSDQHEIITRKSILSYKGHEFYMVENATSLQIDHLRDYDAVILDGADPVFVKFLLKKMRADPDPSFYLKPLFLIHYLNVNDPVTEQLHDGIIFSPEQVIEKLPYIQEIKKRTAHLDQHSPAVYEAQLFQKALNYMYTRELRSFKPFADTNSSIGYSYPLLSIHFFYFEEAKVLDILEWAHKENLIWPDFMDRIYLCNSCSSGRLSYREICPSCHSANLKSEDLVHHFSCGFIGPFSDFKNKVDGTLNCPKCSKALRHIGVDYDKPSVINHCQHCNEVFQDFVVSAKCLQCHTDTDVQYLVPKNIYLYKLTKKGRNAAISGIITAEYNTISDIFGAIERKTFDIMMHYEQERIKQDPASTANIGVISMENIYQLLLKIGKLNEKSFLAELVQVIREKINPADFITIANPALICICLRDRKKEEGIKCLEKITRKLAELVHTNMQFHLTTSFRIESLNKETSFEKQLQRITKDLNEHHDGSPE